MILHAFISPSDEILKIEENIDPSVGTKPGYRWLPVVDIPRPSYDPSLQIAKQNIVLNEDNVTRDWILRDKTAAEIADDKVSKINTIDPVIFKILHSTQNQLRELKNLNTLTEQEYKDLLKELF